MKKNINFLIYCLFFILLIGVNVDWNTVTQIVSAIWISMLTMFESMNIIAIEFEGVDFITYIFAEHATWVIIVSILSLLGIGWKTSKKIYDQCHDHIYNVIIKIFKIINRSTMKD